MLPTLSPATLDDVHAEALKCGYTDQPLLKNFVRLFDVDKVLRKKYLVEGKVSIDTFGKYVWLAAPESKPIPPQKPPVRPAQPRVAPPADTGVSAGPDTTEDRKSTGLETKTKAELKEIADKLKVDIRGLNKDDIIAAITTAQIKGVSA